jgi:tetratricopeptide (TPR) repeat protein
MAGLDDDKPDPLQSTLSAEIRAAAPLLQPGTLIAHYRLGERLGEGGMGVVYRAVDEKLGRPVAIKFLAADRGDAQSKARFLREARAASALDHPNIGTVFEIGEADGAPFIAMALYEGETLRARMRRGPVPVEEVVSIARQLCSALGAAHAAGIVHRDLKPANVMLLPDGTVKLLDFGLAKLTSIDESSLTRDGAILGTLAYMAPEQLRSADVDARADLWSLGALLFELLAGQPPFGVGPAATLVGRILSEAPSPLPDSAPPDLAAVTRALLRKVPGARLASASKVGELIEQRRGPPSRRGLAVGGAIVLSVAAIAGAAALLGSNAPPVTADPAREEYERATRLFSLGRYQEATLVFEREYEKSGDPSLLYNLAQAHRLAGNRERALQLYRAFARETTDPMVRAEADKRIAELTPTPSPTPEPLSEEQVDTAKKIYNQAIRAYEARRYAEAAQGFIRAYELVGEPAILFNVAESYRLARQPDKAMFFFRAILKTLPDDMSKATPEQRNVYDALQQLLQLKSRR